MSAPPSVVIVVAPTSDDLGLIDELLSSDRVVVLASSVEQIRAWLRGDLSEPAQLLPRKAQFYLDR